MQGSTCDAMQGCVGSTEDEASGRAIRHDMQVRMYVVARARPWSPVVCCRSIVDMSTVDCAIRLVQVVGGDRPRHSLATDAGGITWSGCGGGSGGGQGCGCRRAITTIVANPSWSAGRTMDATGWRQPRRVRAGDSGAYRDGQGWMGIVDRRCTIEGRRDGDNSTSLHGSQTACGGQPNACWAVTARYGRKRYVKCELCAI